MAVRQGLPGSLAARVTYLLEPKNWLIVTVLGIGWRAGGLAGRNCEPEVMLQGVVMPAVEKTGMTVGT